MTLQQFIKKLKTCPKEILFAETLQVIEDYFTFFPTAFSNGKIHNKAGENSGSCKVFAFAIHQQFTEKETLFCFGEHYKNVLENPNGTSHQNIRNFMKFGFENLSFESNALKPIIL